MKKLLVIAAAGAVVLSSCGTGGGNLRTDLDSVAYAIGLDVGHQLKMTDSTLNTKLIGKGIADAFENKGTMERDSAGKFLQEYFMVRRPAKFKKESEEFLTKIENENPNIQKTESGLLYEVIRPGDMDIKAEDNRDRVKVFYTGTFPSGAEFDSSKDTAEFRLNGVIKGWTEGMKLVGKGGHIKLWVPSDLAYGQYGRGNIGPNQALVFDIEVLDVIPADTTQIIPSAR